MLAAARLSFGLRIEGLENVPAEGGALVISNHLHNLDPIILTAALPRPLQFMAKQEIFPVPVVGWIARQAGAFPVDRGGADRAAIRKAGALLAQGSLVGIFPEGTRSTTGGLMAPFPGSALLALRSGAPILPTAIYGSETLPFNGAKGRRRRQGGREVVVRIGQPFHLPPRERGESHQGMAELTEAMMREIVKLLPPQYHGIYADAPQPRESAPVSRA
ncbi:MAG TPA: lysophospholipid acyltransferase family protein [Candidatus Limnocylindria bacterium]|nr:lysophospholipid acyltransferase family protein [Candidatus Limnocylindria bacterium]